METTFSVPDNHRVYAIGDIHGEFELLDDLHETIAIDLAKSPADTVSIVYMGDYIDRGPQSREVIDNLILRKGNQDGVNRIFLKGNHEQAFQEFIGGSYGAMAWLEWGGLQTLKSYGINTDNITLSVSEIENLQNLIKQKCPASHVSFLNTLQFHHIIGDYMFVHAGIDPEKPLDGQSEQTMISIREPFTSYDGTLDKCVVYGHTIYDEPKIAPSRIGIDTGAYRNGTLTALVLEGRERRFLYARN